MKPQPVQDGRSALAPATNACVHHRRAGGHVQRRPGRSLPPGRAARKPACGSTGPQCWSLPAAAEAARASFARAGPGPHGPGPWPGRRPGGGPGRERPVRARLGRSCPWCDSIAIRTSSLTHQFTHQPIRQLIRRSTHQSTHQLSRQPRRQPGRRAAHQLPALPPAWRVQAPSRRGTVRPQRRGKGWSRAASISAPSSDETSSWVKDSSASLSPSCR